MTRFAHDPHRTAARLLFHFNQNVVAIDRDHITLCLAACRTAEGLSAGDVELGSVPRAGYFLADQRPFAERSANMRAGVVRRVERPSTLNSASVLSSTTIVLAVPGSNSVTEAIFTVFGIG